jgi:prepilin-type N-terminal cleavage/methylation domain-containing protein
MAAKLRAQLREEGFTLVELLVVMLIIGILAAIAVPIFLNQRAKGYGASAKSDMRLVANEEYGYYIDAHAYIDVTGTAVTTTAPTTPARLTATIGTTSVVLSAYTYVSAQQTGSAGFCLVVKNSQDSTTLVFDSTLGGLQPQSTTTCQAASAY